MLAICCASNLVAQDKPAAAKPDTSKAITFTVQFGPYKKGIPVLVDDMKRLLNADLKVTDNKGQAWTIVSYRLGYRKKDTNDDWKTGKRKTILVFNAVDVQNSPKIPAAWQKSMLESLQSGEEILFEQIIAQNIKTKKMMMPPSLTLTLR
jgi:hypothetical protein